MSAVKLLLLWFTSDSVVFAAMLTIVVKEAKAAA
jgi:hypothetical protein